MASGQSLGPAQADAALGRLEGSSARTDPLCSLGTDGRSPVDASSMVMLCFVAVGSDTRAKASE